MYIPHWVWIWLNEILGWETDLKKVIKYMVINRVIRRVI